MALTKRYPQLRAVASFSPLTSLGVGGLLLCPEESHEAGCAKRTLAVPASPVAARSEFRPGNYGGVPREVVERSSVASAGNGSLVRGPCQAPPHASHRVRATGESLGGASQCNVRGPAGPGSGPLAQRRHSSPRSR